MKNLKIRVPDVPAYMAMPKACGANPTPIAFAEVYLALQSGTVEAQENPLPTIEAKKFYEVQKHIMLTGHIVDGVATQIAPHVWKKLTDDEKKIFTEVTQEAARRGTEIVKQREAKLADEFRKRGLTVDDGRPRRLPEGGPREGADGVDGLRQGRLGQDPGAEVIARAGRDRRIVAGARPFAFRRGISR